MAESLSAETLEEDDDLFPRLELVAAPYHRSADEVVALVVGYEIVAVEHLALIGEHDTDSAMLPLSLNGAGATT